MAKVLVPAERLPVRGATELVAVMPVPASPGRTKRDPGLTAPVHPTGPRLSSTLPHRRREHFGEDIPQVQREARLSGHPVKDLHHSLVVVTLV